MSIIYVSEKTIKSQEYRDSHVQLYYIYSLLKRQLEIAAEITDKNEQLVSRAYFNYHVDGNKKITHVPCNPVHKSDIQYLIDKLEKFFTYNK
jgi:hypothetical protein